MIFLILYMWFTPPDTVSVDTLNPKFELVMQMDQIEHDTTIVVSIEKLNEIIELLQIKEANGNTRK